MERLPERIVTERLLLREWTGDDVGGLTEAIVESREHLLAWMPWAANEPLPPADRLAMIEEWAAQRLNGGDATYGVFADHAIAGGCGLHHRRGRGILEIGYWLHVDHTGRGYATELSAALTDAAFGLAGIERVEIHHDRANVRSGRVPDRLGFAFAGERPDAVTAPGEEGVDCTWTIARDSWLGGEVS